MGLRGGRKHHQGRFVEKAIINSNVEGSTDPRECEGSHSPHVSQASAHKCKILEAPSVLESTGSWV